MLYALGLSASAMEPGLTGVITEILEDSGHYFVKENISQGSPVGARRLLSGRLGNQTDTVIGLRWESIPDRARCRIHYASLEGVCARRARFSAVAS